MDGKNSSYTGLNYNFKLFINSVVYQLWWTSKCLIVGFVGSHPEPANTGVEATQESLEAGMAYERMPLGEAAHVWWKHPPQMTMPEWPLFGSSATQNLVLSCFVLSKQRSCFGSRCIYIILLFVVAYSIFTTLFLSSRFEQFVKGTWVPAFMIIPLTSTKRVVIEWKSMGSIYTPELGGASSYHCIRCRWRRLFLKHSTPRKVPCVDFGLCCVLWVLFVFHHDCICHPRSTDH